MDVMPLEGIRQSEVQRATRVHFVCAEYEIGKGAILAVQPFTVRRSYFPMGTPNVVSEFARIPPGDEAAALRFVKRWGLLGSTPAGDSLEWIWAHANGVSAVLRLCKVPLADENALTGYLHTLHGLKFGQKGHVLTWPFEKDPGVTRMTVLGTIVNPNLTGFYPQLSDGAPTLELARSGRYHVIFAWNSLINVIYRHLADIVVGTSVKICDDCGLPFVSTHARQRFHPAGNGERSLCEQRYTKARRRREGKKS